MNRRQWLAWVSSKERPKAVSGEIVPCAECSVPRPVMTLVDGVWICSRCAVPEERRT